VPHDVRLLALESPLQEGGAEALLLEGLLAGAFTPALVTGKKVARLAAVVVAAGAAALGQPLADDVPVGAVLGRAQLPLPRRGQPLPLPAEAALPQPGQDARPLGPELLRELLVLPQVLG